MKSSILAILPPFNYYGSLSVKADVFAVRLDSQISSKIKYKYNFIFFDGYIDRQYAGEYNKRAVDESFQHAVGDKGDNSKYRGVSLADIDHAGIYCSVFLHCYREALAFLSLIDRFKPTKIIISAYDPNIDIFTEMSKQMITKIETIQSFGKINKNKRELIRRSNRSLDVGQFNLWHPRFHQPIWAQAATLIFNTWSWLIRFIRGKKPFIYIDCHGHLNRVKGQLSLQKKYYPFFSRLTKLPIISLLLSGFYVMSKQNKSYENKEVLLAIKNYKKHLKTVKNKKTIGRIDFKHKKYFIADLIIQRLNKYAPRAFKQIADNIDLYENFINKNNVCGALVSSDINWENRMIVKLFQKHAIENMAHMNGWFAAHTVEYKTADKVLCFGTSHTKTCFKNKKNTKITGSPKFDAAYKKRSATKPQYPIKKILVSTFVFPPNDINGHYSDTEKYIHDVLTVIKKYNEQYNDKIRIALRPHPSELPDFYHWYLKKLGFVGIDLELGKNFQNIVPHYDLFFASYSSTLFETAAMGIPVIFYHPSNQILYYPFDGSCKELPQASSLKNLKKIFDLVMKNKDYAYKFTNIDILKSYVGKLDNKSTLRIIDEVNKTIKLK